MIKGNILANLAKTLSKQHRWFSGRMLACHAVARVRFPDDAVQTPFSKVQKQLKLGVKTCVTPPGGLEPPTFRLTAGRASQLRHGGLNAAL